MKIKFRKKLNSSKNSHKLRKKISLLYQNAILLIWIFLNQSSNEKHLFQLLMCAVSRHGAKDWAKVAAAVQNRNDSQCRERWMNVLNRSAHVSERFTLAEDEQLLYAVKVFGKGNWAKCQLLLPKKTARQLRRRYVQLIAAKLRVRFFLVIWSDFCHKVLQRKTTKIVLRLEKIRCGTIF